MGKTAARRPRLGLGVPRRRRPSSGVPWLRIDPAMPGYPWEGAGLHPSNFPTPGLFWDADERTEWMAEPHFDEVVRAALGSALIMAGADPALATSRTSQSRRLRQQMRRIVITAPFNDRLYGCTNANYCGGSDPSMEGSQGRTHEDMHVLGPKGRGLHWGKIHVNNRERIASGTAPARAITEDGEPLLLDVIGSRPLIWIPPINLETLRDVHVATVDGVSWSDDTSPIYVPPRVKELGLLEDVRTGDLT